MLFLLYSVFWVSWPYGLSNQLRSWFKKDRSRKKKQNTYSVFLLFFSFFFSSLATKKSHILLINNSCVIKKISISDRLEITQPWTSLCTKIFNKKIHLTTQNFEKSHSAFFVPSPLTQFSCIMTQLDWTNQTAENKNFEKSHSAFFVPFPLIYRFQPSTKKVKNSHSEEGGGGRGYLTVNNGILPRCLRCQNTHITQD